MRIDILGVLIDDLEEGEVLEDVALRLDNGQQTFIATPNPEMIVLAEKDQEFKDILNSADIKITDGHGLQRGAKFLGKKITTHVTGTDFMVSLCRLAKERSLSIYLLGAAPTVARRAAENLKKAIPGLQIAGAEHGGKMDTWDNRVILEHINVTKPDILFVALGQRKQEKWISQNLKKMESVKVAMGVGGAFDYISGSVKRAPEWMRNRGLEWLYRLIKEPHRLKRIYTAVFVFPWLCFKNKKQ